PDGDIWRLGLTPEEIIERVPPNTQAIGITSMWSYSWPIVRELIQKLRVAFPKTPIVCGGDGKIHKNPRRDRIKNVDELPWPAWELFDIEAYSSNRLVSGIYYGKTV